MLQSSSARGSAMYIVIVDELADKLSSPFGPREKIKQNALQQIDLCIWKLKRSSAGIRTWIAEFKVPSAHHYTTEPNTATG